MNDPLENEKQAILAAALRHVPFDGWSRATLDVAVRDAGYEATMAARAFPNGLRDLIAFFVADADRRLAWELTKQDLAKLPIRERIRTAVKLRIEQNAPHREAIRKAVALQLMPGFGELMRKVSLEKVPTAILSRQTAAIRGKSLIVNLPGQPKAIRECLDAVMPAIPYCVDLIEGPRLETNPDRIVAFRPKK